METIQLPTYFVLAVCGAMAFFNLVRVRSRGPRGVAMAVAFVAFGGLVVALQAPAPVFVQASLGVLVFVALASDAFLAPRRPNGAPR